MLGNGDVFAAGDALRMMAQTGCDGVVVGRGCLGRPWLFAELQAAFRGEPIPAGPNLGQVGRILHRHAVLLTEHLGADKGIRDLRKHMAWYLKGFPVGSDLRRKFAMVDTIGEIEDLIAQLDHDAPYPQGELGRPRGRQGSPRHKVVMPTGWLDDTSGCELDLAEAELDSSGG